MEEHTNACLDAGIMLFGTNGEVISGQRMKPPDSLTVSDHLWLARWLLYRIGEEYGITCYPSPEIRSKGIGMELVNRLIS